MNLANGSTVRPPTRTPQLHHIQDDVDVGSQVKDVKCRDIKQFNDGSSYGDDEHGNDPFPFVPQNVIRAMYNGNARARSGKLPEPSWSWPGTYRG
jgi:hypothetical protein